MRRLVGLCFLGLSACALMERHPKSGYYNEAHETSYRPTDLYVERRLHLQEQAREELGLTGRPLSPVDRVAIQDRVRLKRLEANLTRKREKQQYYSIRSELRSDKERIYFLSLPTYEARERWAARRGLGTDQPHSDEIASLIEANDIALGMTQKAVTESWGDPDAIEIAGNPIYGFERWKYHRYVSGNDGYQKELRVIYFEGGRVVGWERQ